MVEEEIIVIEDEIEEEIIVMEEAIEKVYPELQDKIVVPTKQEQKVKADEGIYGLNEVTIEPVTNLIDENIKAENIRSGVSVLGVEGTAETLVGTEITINPTSEEQIVTPISPNNGFTKITIGAQSGVDINNFFETTITNSNGIYFARDNMIKKLPEFTVDASTTSLQQAFYGIGYADEIVLKGNTSNVKSCYQMFYQCTNLSKAPEMNTSSVENMGAMFNSCSNLTFVPEYDTSNVTDMSYIFSGCSSLTSIPTFNTSKVSNM